jgi:ethanolamine utilization protein EutA
LSEPPAGGRIFFSTRGRTLVDDEQIELTSAGVDIGSSTSHLVFSRIVLERLDSRYLVTKRETLYRSEILLTPYLADGAIDADTLGRFFERQYARAGLRPEDIETGALVLTGVAVRRHNARAIGDLFAQQAGRLVAVSAGDSLETVMAAHGSGAVARSKRLDALVMNIDIGGGTSKIAVCSAGKVIDRTAVDLGARIICTDREGRIVRLEKAAHWLANDLGLDLQLGAILPSESVQRIASRMARLLITAMQGGARDAGIGALMRLDALSWRGRVDVVTVSGGVAEYLYGTQQESFDDLGPSLAAAFRTELAASGYTLEAPDEGIRATVIGASQYTSQVSGSTIFVAPLELLPLRNLPVLAPDLPLDAEELDAGAIAAAIGRALTHMELEQAESSVALFVPWRGSASYSRLDAFCRGALEGLAPVLTGGRALVLAGDGDVGGLLGVHLKEEIKVACPIVSVDGLELKPFDYIDIGAMLPSSGAVPVIIKSLVFPADDSLGRSIRDTAQGTQREHAGSRRRNDAA